MDLMVDIETLSTSQHNAVVTSIGAVQFALTPAGPRYFNEGSRCPDLRLQIISGREVDPDTVRFWQDHRDAAKHWLNAPVTGVAETMRWLADMYSGGKCESVWTHGTDFDVPNIRSLFVQAGVECPWKYNMVRDARTIYKALPEVHQWTPPIGNRTEHEAVSDCKNQIDRLWNRLCP